MTQVINNLLALGTDTATLTLGPDPSVNTFLDLRADSVYPDLSGSVAQVQIGGSGEITLRIPLKPGLSVLVLDGPDIVYNSAA